MGDPLKIEDHCRWGKNKNKVWVHIFKRNIGGGGGGVLYKFQIIGGNFF